MKTKTSKHEEIYSLAWFRFQLPNHFQFTPSMTAMGIKPDKSRRVVDNIYRTPEPKIESKPAKPLDDREAHVKFMALLHSSRDKRDAAAASTDAEKAIIVLLNLARAGDWQGGMGARGRAGCRFNRDTF